mmetsp:Transcript_24362/g.34849  ORF Transcript_24362/g.34849 Transcript_24362/m.34849 type:complete len:93 (+) Transcript_24362:439-717(+)
MISNPLGNTGVNPKSTGVSELAKEEITTEHANHLRPTEICMFTFVTALMSTKASLKCYGQAGQQAILKELEQLLYRKVMEGNNANTLTREQK